MARREVLTRDRENRKLSKYIAMMSYIRIAAVPYADDYNKNKEMTRDKASDIRNLASLNMKAETYSLNKANENIHSNSPKLE